MGYHRSDEVGHLAGGTAFRADAPFFIEEVSGVDYVHDMLGGEVTALARCEEQPRPGPSPSLVGVQGRKGFDVVLECASMAALSLRTASKAKD